MKLINCLFIAMMIFLPASKSHAITNIAAFMPSDARFQSVLKGIQSELGSAYHLEVIDMTKPRKLEEIASQCKQLNSEALILMDTKAVTTALELQNLDSSFAEVPKFVVMTLLVEASTEGLLNVAGIKYEIPIYTLITKFRIISNIKFSKVAIFYRKLFAESIKEAKNLLTKEQMSLCAVCIDCENEETTPDNALDIMNSNFTRLVEDQKVKVFLALADNLVINSKSLSEFWLGKVKENQIPVIAPLASLATAKIGVAVFTADPDLLQLGSQVANQIIDHFENGTSLQQIGFEPTISIKSTLNKTIADEIGWKLKEEKLKRISTIIK